jgi:hypothetical protein
MTVPAERDHAIDLHTPVTDTEFLTCCRDLATALRGIAAHIAEWVGGVLACGLPHGPAAALDTIAPRLCDAAADADRAAATFAKQFSDARQLAARGLHFTGEATSPQLASGHPTGPGSSEAGSGYEAEAAALRERLKAAPCPRCGRGPHEHTLLPDAASHARAWCDLADGETPTPYATAPQTTPNDDTAATALRPDQVQGRIRAAYDSLAPRPGAWLRHTDVRRELGDLPTEVLNEAFRLLSRAQDVDMMPESNQKTLTAEDWRNAVWVGGMDTHLIAIGIR